MRETMRSETMENRLLAFAAAALIFGLAWSGIAHAECTENTGLTSHLIAGAVNVPPGTPIEAITESGECAGRAVYDGSPLALTLWGADSLSAAILGRTGGFNEGEEIAYMATESDVTGEIAYRLYPYAIGYDNMGAGNFFAPDALTEADLLMPAIIDTATARWDAAVVTPPDSTSMWTATLGISSGVPLGAVIIELRLSPTDSLRPTIHTVSPAADTYMSGDTLAAWYIGAGSTNVFWSIQGTGSGRLEIRRIRATDRDSSLLAIAVDGPLSVEILPYAPPIAGDIDDSGIVDAADVGLLFVALVTDGEGALQRADVFPAGGDGVVDLLDLYYLARAVAQGRWWDGRAL